MHPRADDEHDGSNAKKHKRQLHVAERSGLKFQNSLLNLYNHSKKGGPRQARPECNVARASSPIGQPRNPLPLGAVVAAEESIAGFQSMADHTRTAHAAMRRQRVDGTLEAIKGVSLAPFC